MDNKDFAIRFAIGVGLLIVFLCVCTCMSLCAKVDTKTRKFFDIVKYKEKYKQDKELFEKEIPRKDKNKQTASKLLCKSDEKDIESHSSTNPLTSTVTDTDSSKEKKRVICFTFDNLTPMLKASSVFNQDDESHDPYLNLSNFVNVVVESCCSEDTEIIIIISSPGKYFIDYSNYNTSQLIYLYLLFNYFILEKVMSNSYEPYIMYIILAI